MTVTSSIPHAVSSARWNDVRKSVTNRGSAGLAADGQLEVKMEEDAGLRYVRVRVPQNGESVEPGHHVRCHVAVGGEQAEPQPRPRP